ncbi:MAG TPA: DUF5687 family protein [Paludibacter sp.]|nr:DUF5687 family protein [Paludibacter sp.]
MLLLDLISQEWKKNYRAQGFYKNLAVNIMLGFVGLYFSAILLFMGFSLDDILEGLNYKLNPMELFNQTMLYILLAGLVFRFFMQQLHTFNLPPYQVLPVKRSYIVNFLLLKPLFSPINYFLLLVVVPFAVQSVAHYYSGWVAFRFVLDFVFVVWFNSQMATYLKRKFGSGLLPLLVILAVALILAGLEYSGLFSLLGISLPLFNFIVLKPYGPAFTLFAAVGAFLLNKWFFLENYYPEKFDSKIESSQSAVGGFSFLNRFGVVGEIISMEIKLIVRHKRTKSILFMSGIFLFYGLMFYGNKSIYSHSEGMLFFAAIFITGILMLMFGQWVVSWDSAHFDCLMTRNIPVRSYLKANYLLMIASNVVCFVLTAPYFFFGIKIVYLHLAAFIFNSGVNVFLLLFFASFNSRRVDLSKSAAMNYQGTTYKSFLIVLPIMFLPMLLVGGLTALFSFGVALWCVSILGVGGILFREQLLDLCVGQFNRRKYIMAKGFRERE